ncbi:MAG: NADH-quinone oxidoreductase subunit C [Candidatus Cloacimonadaceae bacterium]|nr:NADH-quinone oxidoreductase subunit C [Candidatus Cloacimonadaceae bacterium]MDP3113437.1 NADH-quinone oxidoreductase subunit C [Candidatus Cloacimonadaceae bacterium]
MNIEQYITDIQQRFPEIISTEVINTKRLMVYIPKSILPKITDHWFNKLQYRYIVVSAMDSKDGYELIYHYSDDETGWVMSLNVMLAHDNPEVESMTPIVYGIEWIEREIMDILGIKFLNHPKPERFLLAESWPDGDYPYRRKIRKGDR